MPTEFRFEHTFRAPKTTTILAAYFDPDHLATQDKLAELTDRVVVDSSDDGATLATTWRVSHARPLPLFVRPLVSGGRLRFLEAMSWRRADDEVDFTVAPEILGGRVSITGVYQLRHVGEHQILRCYRGTVTVNVRLLSSKIERGIVDKFEQSMPLMAACTQRWLDNAAPRTSSP